MSMFMAAMAQELREKGQIKGLGGMSAGAWRNEIAEYEAKLAEARERDRFRLDNKEESK